MEEKIFITGICGFIGSHLAAEAIRQGYEVSGLAHCGKPVPGATVTVGDIRDRELVRTASRGADYFLHLAAVTSNLEFESKTDYSFDVNVGGFFSAIEAARTNRCSKFLYASSAAIYIDSFSEKSAIPFDAQKNHYAKTKMMNEMIAESYTKVGGLHTLGLRFFNVYGPGENDKGNYASIISQFVSASKTGKDLVIYGDGSQARDLIHVNDVAAVMLKLMKSDAGGVLNVGTGKATSYEEIAGVINGAKKVHVRNPLSSYQHLTRADTAELLRHIGRHRFIDVNDGIATMLS